MIQEEQLASLLLGNEHRGNDATGLAISHYDGSVHVYKTADPAWRFVSSKGYEDFLAEFLTDQTWAVILHTRGATVGNPLVVANNHPMFSGETAVVHNGGVRNDKELFFNLKLDRKVETDSDIFRAIIDRYGITQEGISKLSEVRGSAAIAAVSTRFPRQLLLMRSGSPLTIGSTEDGLFFFSSEKHTLYNATRPYIERYGIWFQEQRAHTAFAPMSNDTAWIIGQQGKQYHQQCKTLMGAYQEPFRRTYSEYNQRRSRWENEQRNPTATAGKSWDQAYCHTCKRSWVIPTGKNPSDFHCDTTKNGCGRTLTGPVVKVN